MSGSGEPTKGSIADKALQLTEDIVYGLVCVVLAAGALALLVKTAYDLVTGLPDDVLATVTSSLDSLLLVFILIELLGAVRTTVTERQLVAEPFLLVGVIATIKEIVIGSLQAKELAGSPGDAFADTMVEIGVLAGVLLILALASFLLRRKEREPEETEGDAESGKP